MFKVPLTRLLAVAALLLLPANGLHAQERLKGGDKFPDFKLPYATKDTVDFAGIGSEDLKGQRYLIAFYPADWSPGCTKEMCSFRDAITDFEQLDIQVLPVSGDYVFSHHEWAKHHGLPFKLLADQTRELGRKVGVYNESSGMMKRSVFVVGSDGRLEYVDYDYSVADSSDFAALKAGVAGK